MQQRIVPQIPKPAGNPLIVKPALMPIPIIHGQDPPKFDARSLPLAIPSEETLQTMEMLSRPATREIHYPFQDMLDSGMSREAAMEAFAIILDESAKNAVPLPDPVPVEVVRDTYTKDQVDDMFLQWQTSLRETIDEITTLSESQINELRERLEQFETLRNNAASDEDEIQTLTADDLPSTGVTLITREQFELLDDSELDRFRIRIAKNVSNYAKDAKKKTAYTAMNTNYTLLREVIATRAGKTPRTPTKKSPRK